MRLSYDEVIELLKKKSGGRGVEWYPEYHQLILFQESGNYTFNKNRWDNLDLSNREFWLALEIYEVEGGMYEVVELNKKEVENF